MLLPRIARLAAVGAALLVAGLGCSGDDKRDQYYGTDVGANWIPPDATAREASVAQDGGPDGAEAGTTDGGSDAADGGVDAAGGGDTAPSFDAPASDTF